jgi:16S rRNA (cytidine1402-2'-O)-methyltransferase
VYSTIRALSHFIVEEEKSARQLLKRADPTRPIRELSIERLNEHTDPGDLDRLMAPLRAGHSLGVISEAGCPAIADPGAAIVSRAHHIGASVHPLVGPCSMVLALMASGFNGQRWRFSGYPPREEPARRQALQALEAELYARGETQILMEPPYRNQKLLSDLIALCRPETTLCVALGLTTPAEQLQRHTIAQWRAHPRELPRIPAIFLLGRPQ